MSRDGAGKAGEAEPVHGRSGDRSRRPRPSAARRRAGVRRVRPRARPARLVRARTRAATPASWSSAGPATPSARWSCPTRGRRDRRPLTSRRAAGADGGPHGAQFGAARVRIGYLRRSCDAERSSRSRRSSPRSRWPACRFPLDRGHPRSSGPWMPASLHLTDHPCERCGAQRLRRVRRCPRGRRAPSRPPRPSSSPARPPTAPTARPRSTSRHRRRAQPGSSRSPRCPGSRRFYDNGTTAMRLPRGTVVRICGDGGCIQRTVTDYGPAEASRGSSTCTGPTSSRSAAARRGPGTTRVTVSIY